MAFGHVNVKKKKKKPDAGSQRKTELSYTHSFKQL